MAKTKLLIKINNKKPMELNELTNSLNALVKEYDSYCKDNFDITKSERKLEVLKLENGSLLLELAPVALPIIQELDVALSFGTHIIEILDYFTGKKDKLSSEISTKTCDNVMAFINPSANDNGSSFTLNVIGNNNNVTNGGSWGSLELNAAQKWPCKI